MQGVAAEKLTFEEGDCVYALLTMQRGGLILF
jgi:hypothetical protein